VVRRVPLAVEEALQHLGEHPLVGRGRLETASSTSAASPRRSDPSTRTGRAPELQQRLLRTRPAAAQHRGARRYACASSRPGEGVVLRVSAEPRPATCGKTNHIQWPRLAPAAARAAPARTPRRPAPDEPLEAEGVAHRLLAGVAGRVRGAAGRWGAHELAHRRRPAACGRAPGDRRPLTRAAPVDRGPARPGGSAPSSPAAACASRPAEVVALAASSRYCTVRPARAAPDDLVRLADRHVGVVLAVHDEQRDVDGSARPAARCPRAARGPAPGARTWSPRPRRSTARCRGRR
jgi:hypothetical protein